MKIYLASPYSHESDFIRKERFLQVCKKAAEIMLEGHIVFSPIAHSHPISKYIGNPNDSEFYLKQDMSFIDWCDEVWIFAINGWQQSNGIQAEIEYAAHIGKPVKLVFAT